MFGENVFERRGADTLSRQAFFAVIGIVLTWGFAATAYVAERTADWQPDILTFLLVGLGIPLVGIFMSVSTNALISFLGFNLVAIPFGAILGPALARYELAQPGIVAEAAALTAGVTAVMALSGVLFPRFYAKIGGALFTALLCLVGISLLGMFIPALAAFTPIHYLAAGLFALYIGYDMHRACTVPATIDNAVDCCISLYLDIINLLLRILQIMSKK